MKTLVRTLLLIQIMFVPPSALIAQQMATGTPPFGSFTGGPDIVNLGNLNVYLDIPMRHKAGRGTDFDYNLTYNSSLYYPGMVGSTTVWTPTSWNGSWGWNGITTVGQNYANYDMTYTHAVCGMNHDQSYDEWQFSGLVYYDEHGVTHSFAGAGGTYFNSPGGNYCPDPGAHPSGSLRVPNPDGMVSYTSVGAGSMQVQLYAKNGTLVQPAMYVNYSGATSSSSSADTNGNIISMSNGVYTDTLGQTALAIVGIAPSNTVLSFSNDDTGDYSDYTVMYTTHSIKTNFGCAGVTEYSASNIPLPNSIELPDGRSYQFTYEGTPGNPGSTTGRVASVTLPTGGIISYTYTGGKNGIECADGTTAGLTRTTPDGQYTYARTGSGTQWTTTVTAPAYQGVSDKTVIKFLTSGWNFYEISRKLYSGSSTLLETVLHCYANSDSTCSSTTGETDTSITWPIARVKTTYQWPDGTGKSAGTLDTYDTLGNSTLHEMHDYASGGVYGGILQQTITTYSNAYSTAQQEVPTEVTVKDSAGTQISDTQYSYTATTTPTTGTPQHYSGPPTLSNLSSVASWVSGSSCSTPGNTCLTKSFTYYDTGLVHVATDVNGGQTTYAYGNCGNSFPTAVSTQTGGPVVTSLGTSATWDCIGGVPTETGDVNGTTTAYTYTGDPYWRPTSIENNVSKAVVTLSYPSSSANYSSSAMSFNSGTSTNTSVTSYDGLGRTVLQQTQQAPGSLSSATFDTVATAYDARGRGASTTLPYSAGLGVNTPTNPGTSYSYDALGRISGITDSGTGSKQYSYTSNDVLVTVDPQVITPHTENLKKRNLEYNGAGWLMSVCEVVTSTLPAGGACGQAVGYTGYLTNYTYDGGGRLTKVQQDAQPGPSGVQTRLIGYDGLGRKTSETIPEWSAGSGVAGNAAYTYDSDSTGSCSGAYPGDLVKSIDNMQNVTCYTNDLLHRPLTSNAVSGPYSYAFLQDPNKATPIAYFVYDAATVNGNQMQNAKGSLAEAYTCSGSCTSKLTDEGFSTILLGSGTLTGGMQSKMWESTPHSNGYFLTTDNYYPNGILGSMSASLSGSGFGIPALTFGVDPAGRPYSATGANTIVASTTYYPGGLVNKTTYGNASSGSANDFDQFAYDPNTNRPTNLTYSISPNSGTFTLATALTWNPNGSLQEMKYTDGSPNPMSQDCQYSADDLGRIAQVDCGSSAWGQKFAYDPFGNIQKSVPTGQTGTTYQTNGYYSVTNQAKSGATYDLNGNQLTSTPATLTWNAWNVPISVNSTSATYDALGRMVEKVSGTTNTQFVFRPSGDILAVYESAGPNIGLVKGTIGLPGGGTAVYNANGFNYFRHKDWLGSSVLATTWQHAVYSKQAYAPFGETYNESTSTPDRSFTGQDQDLATASGGGGVYDFLFRKYDPSAGRWLSPDPSGWDAASPSAPQSLNRYAYVDNAPMQAIDFQGLSCIRNDLYDSNGNLTSSVYVDNGDGAGCPEAGVAPGPTGTNDGTVSDNVYAGNGACNGNPTCVVVNPSPDCNDLCLNTWSNLIQKWESQGKQVYVLPLQGQPGATSSSWPANRQQQQQQQQKNIDHGCTVASGLLVLGDAAILLSGQEYLAPAALSLSFHVWAACGWATW